MRIANETQLKEKRKIEEEKKQVEIFREMLARQVTAVISSSGEPHRKGLRQTHLRHQVAIMSKKLLQKYFLTRIIK